MQVAVRASSMTLRILWLLALILGISLATGILPGVWVLAHMGLGLLIVALLWFLGVAQALVKGGSLILTVTTFVVGLLVAIIGLSQPQATSIAVLRTLQGAHIVLVLAAIALGEICAARYRRGSASATLA